MLAMVLRSMHIILTNFYLLAVMFKVRKVHKRINFFGPQFANSLNDGICASY